MPKKRKTKKMQNCIMDESCERYKAMYEFSQDAIITLEPPGWNFTSGNPSAVKIFNTKSEKKLKSLSLEDLSSQIQPDGQKSKAKALKMIKKAMRDGSVFFEWTHKRYGGSNFPATVLLTKFKLGNKYIIEGTVRDISMQKELEESLKIKNFVFDYSFSSNSIADKKGIITDVNKSFLNTWGFSSKKQVIGKPISLFFNDKKDASLVLESINKKGDWKGEFIAKKRNGSIFYAFGVATKLFNNRGELIGYQSSLFDVTDRKKSEKKIKKSQERFRDISSSSSDWVWEVNSKAEYIFVSDGVKKILGYTPNEMIGKTPLDFMPKDEAERVGKIFKEILKYKKDINDLENINLHKNGKQVTLITNGVPFFDGNKFLGYRGLDKDITNKKESEIKLKESRERFKDLFNNMKDCVVIYEVRNNGRDFLFKAVNRSAEKLEKIKESEVEYKNIKKVFPGVEKMGILDVLRRVYKTGEAEEFNEKFYEDKKRSGWRNNFIYKIPSGEIVTIYQDITDKKNSRIILLEKIKELEKINKLMVGRELKMVELKEEIEKIKKK